MDRIFNISELPVLIAEALPGEIPVPLQLLQGGANAIRTLLADFSQAPGGVVPVLRQGQHHGEQPFGFQRQSRVA